jgi:hypothetical protein
VVRGSTRKKVEKLLKNPLDKSGNRCYNDYRVKGEHLSHSNTKF